MYTLIGGTKTRTFRVRWLLEELEQPYTHHPAGPRSEAVTTHYPAGKIPVLLDDDTALTDSTAILTYLSDKHGAFTHTPGSIERGMDRIKMILTPKKRLNSTADGPRKVKVNKSGNSIYPTFIQSLFVTRLSNQYSVLDLAYNPLKNRQLEFTAKILDFAIYVCMYVHESGRARRIVTLRDGVLGHP